MTGLPFQRKYSRAGWRNGAAFLAIAAGLACSPAAFAQTAREAELEARLNQLEAAVAALKGELAQARTEQQATAAQVATSAQVVQKTDTRVAALESKPTAPAEGFKVGATTFRLGGFVKVVASASRYDDGEVAGGSLGKEFYLPQQIPVGGANSSRDVISHARQTRLFFDTSTPFGGNELRSHIEFDFALAAAPLGAQRATNAYTPTFRRGFITWGNWLVGQEWTTFQNPNLFPETTDFVGPMDGAIFVRQAMIQYRKPLSADWSLYVAAENPQTETISTTSATLSDNDTDRVPDLVAKLAYRGKLGEMHIAAIHRTLSIHSNGRGDDATAWGVSAGGKLPFGPHGRHDLRFNATYGQGMGRYFTVGFAPDAVYDVNVADKLYVVDNFAGFAALRLGWTDKLRSTFMASYQKAWYPEGITIPGTANESAYSFAGNLFYSPVKNLDLGIEYRHGQREVASGLTGQLDRLEMAAKYTF